MRQKGAQTQKHTIYVSGKSNAEYLQQIDRSKNIDKFIFKELRLSGQVNAAESISNKFTPLCFPAPFRSVTCDSRLRL